MQSLIVTGGAGFVGSNFVRYVLNYNGEVTLVNLDLLTYAGNLESLEPFTENPRYVFVHGDIRNRSLVRGLLSKYRPRAVVSLAAESHVDRSIDSPSDFIQTNVIGTFDLLEAACGYWSQLSVREREEFRFLHVSTDEVYGSLGPEGYFTEESPYKPRSPYAASKAAADHFVRACYHTYELPTMITNCSNNYGPYQFPEKLIPLMILKALQGAPLPVYGDGQHVRDWLYVEDHCRALQAVLERGRLGETYNIGGNNERTNLQVVHAICDLLNEMHPRHDGRSYREQIAFVKDRPGHDRRYAIDATKIMRELGWAPRENFESGLRKTVRWYLDNLEWCRRVQDASYRGERLGLRRVRLGEGQSR